MGRRIVRHRGGYLEDFTPGKQFRHHWGRTVLANDTVFFSTMTMNYNPVYFNAEYAQALGYERLPVNPLFVFNLVLGLSVEDLSEAGGPFLGIDDMRFPRVVYPGDTIRAFTEVISARESETRAGWGIVKWRTWGVNQRDELVTEFYRTNLARCRPADVEETTP
jgi:acyl dehydratase